MFHSGKCHHKFIHTSDQGPVNSVEFTVDGHTNLSDMLEAFTCYLKAVGFAIDDHAVLDFNNNDITNFVNED